MSRLAAEGHSGRRMKWRTGDRNTRVVWDGASVLLQMSDLGLKAGERGRGSVCDQRGNTAGAGTNYEEQEFQDHQCEADLRTRDDYRMICGFKQPQKVV